MARTPQSEEIKAQKAAERAELLSTRKKRSPKTNEPTPDSMKTPQPPTESTENTSGTQSPAQTTAPEQPANTQAKPAPETAEPIDNIVVKHDIPKPTLGNPADFQPDSTFAPMGGNKINRSYSRPQINPNLKDIDIPEVNITAEQFSQKATTEILKGPADQKPIPVIPAVEGFDNLSPNEKQLAAEKTADLILGAYDRVHWLGRKYVSADIDDLTDDHRRGEINMNLGAFEDEDDPDKHITIKEYFEDFNAQVEEEFTLKEDFKNQVRAPLERVCLKHGWGASDELYLAFKFAEDLAVKVSMLVGFKKLTNKYMAEFKDDHAKIKAQVAAERKRQELEAERKRQIEKDVRDRLAEEERQTKEATDGTGTTKEE